MLLCKEIFRPGVPTQTALNVQASNELAIVAGAFLLVSIGLTIVQRYRHPDSVSFRASLLAIILMAAHPAWTVSVRSGDCGMMRQVFSWVVAGILALVVLGQLVCLVFGLNRGNSQAQQDYDDKFRPGPPDALH
jgi:disulfide bond formation protein DsbB